MNTRLETDRFPSSDSGLERAAVGAATFILRAACFFMFVLLSAFEPFMAIVCGTLALACFFISIVFGFILHEPFAQRWQVLFAGFILLLVYMVYGTVLAGVRRLMQ